MRTSTFVMIGFAVLFGLLAVFLAQTWLNNQAEQRMREPRGAAEKPRRRRARIVVASKPLRFGDELTSAALREMPWPDDALPAGAFGKIAELTAGKRVVLMPIDTNEAVLASKITGPGQRATLSAMLSDGMKAVTIRVNDVEGVAGFVLPGDRVDVVLTRAGDKNNAINDVVLQNVRVLAIDQLADERADKPSVVKAVTLEVDVDRRAEARAGGHGRHAVAACCARPATPPMAIRGASRIRDLMTARRPGESQFVTIGVMRPSQGRARRIQRAGRGRATRIPPRSSISSRRTTENLGCDQAEVDGTFRFWGNESRGGRRE